MLLALLLACSSSKPPETPPSATPVAAASAGPVVDAEGFANVAPAVVTEALAGDGRSYLHIQEASYDFWVSVPAGEFASGDHVKLGTGPLVAAKSAALSRDFPAITVIEKVARVAPGADEVLAPPPGGLSVASIYAQKATLAGKPVVLRGRVVKANDAIFGKNWYHLRDGTGAPGSDDIAVTTDGTAHLGEVVTASAPLTVDKDLGFGYFFPILLEDAQIVVDGATPARASGEKVLAPGTTPTEAASAASEPGAASAPPTPALPPAPTRTVYGLGVGTLDQPGLDAWITAHHVGCTTSPALRRTTVRTECKEGLEPSLFPERPNTGKFSDLLFSRNDAGPIHYVALAAKFSIPASAAADFSSRQASLTASLGTPSTLRPLDAGALAGKLVRFAASWRFADLNVDLSLFRAGGEFTTVTETWAVPGVEGTQGARPGTKGHSGMVAHPEGWNPHVISEAAPIQSPG